MGYGTPGTTGSNTSTFEFIIFSGPIVPDNEKPTVPPNDNCEYGWHYFSSTQKCYLHTIDEKAWKAAQQTCEGFGGNLASINSPTVQEELLAFAGLDPTALGTLQKLLN